MKKLTTLLVAAAASMYFIGCGDAGTNVNNGIMGKNTSSSSTNNKTGDSDTEKKEDYDESVEFAEDLPKCTAKKDEKVYYVEEEDITYTCNYDENLKMGEWVKEKKKAKKPVADETIESGDDLPKCSDKRDGDIYYIEEDDAYVECNAEKGKWVTVKTQDDDDFRSSASKSSSSATKTIPSVTFLYDLPTCTGNLEGSMIYVVETEDNYYCAVGTWYGINYGGTWPDYPESSSGISHPYFSPSGKIPCGDMWCGPEGLEQVKTGLGNATKTFGYWFNFDDSREGGRSSIKWPVPKGNEYDPNSLYPIITYCSGVCSTTSLDKRTMTYDAYAGIGFNIVGETSDSNKDIAAGDASAWGGVCIVYSSDIDLRFEMGLGDTIDHELHDGPPSVTLPYGEMMVKNFLWDDFKMPSWAVDMSGISITGPQAAEMLVSLKIIVQGSDGQYDFNVMSIGKYGTCI